MCLKQSCKFNEIPTDLTILLFLMTDVIIQLTKRKSIATPNPQSMPVDWGFFGVVFAYHSLRLSNQ